MLLLCSFSAAAFAKNRKPAPKQLLGAQTWRLLQRAKQAEVALVATSADGAYLGEPGIKAEATATPSPAWLARLRRLLRQPSSYFVPPCDKGGRCPALRCRTTPRSVITLKRGKESTQLVITVCNALRAGPTLAQLGAQVSLEPAEGKLLRLLLQLFPKDQRLRQELKDWRDSR